MRKPNFFIVGAPRCGTTALFTYLRQHPDIFMPLRKEPRYFARDLDSGTAHEGRYFIRTEKAYLHLFKPAGSARRVGEATPLYLYSREAARLIREYCGEDVRIIVMLRNPVDIMHSFHSERYVNGNEDIADFAEALASEEARRRGEKLPRRGHIPLALQYRDLVRLSSQIDRYLETFGRERVLFVLYEDLARDTARVYREVLRFLEVDDTFEPSFEIINASKRIRSPRLRSLINQPPDRARRLALRILPVWGRNFVKREVRRWNVVPSHRAVMDPELRGALLEEFTPEIERLERIVGRDLSHWKRQA